MSNTYNDNMDIARACIDDIEKEEQRQEQKKQEVQEQKNEKSRAINRESKQRIINIKEQEEKKAGFIVLSRDILQSSVWSNPSLLQFYIYCIMRASFKDKYLFLSNEKVAIKRGQFVTSISNLAKELRLTPKKTRGRLNALKQSSKLASKGTNKYTLITVIDYDYWQGEGQAKGQAKGKTEGKQRATSNNVNNVNNKEKYKKKKKIDSYFEKSVSVFEKVLGVFYFERNLKFENLGELKKRVLEDNQAFTREIKVISGLKLEEYQPIMANLSQKGELTLSNVVQYIQQKSAKQGEKVDELRQDLVDKLGFDF